MKSLFPFIKLFKKQLWWMLLGIFLAFVTVFCSIGLLSLSGWFISMSAYISTSFALATAFNFLMPSAGVRAFAMLRIVGRYGDRVISHDATFKVLTNVRVWFYEKLEPLAPAHFMQHRSGDLLARMVGDVDALENLYIRVLSPSIVMFIVACLMLCFFHFFDVQIAWLTFGVLLLSAFGVPLLFAKFSKSTSQSLALQQASLSATVLEYMQGLPDLKIFGADESHLNQLRQDNKALIKIQRRMSIFAGLSQAFIMLLMGLTMVCVVWLAVNLVAQGNMSGAMIALLALGVMAVFEAIMPVPVAYQYLGKTVTSAKRLLSIVQQKPAVVFSDSAHKPTCYDIAYHNISFAYEGRDPVFDQFNLTIPQGQKLALLGETGAGKSTLIHLLGRFWDVDTGSIKIGGVNIQEMNENNLREVMTVLSQHDHIFNATVRENLLLGDEGASDDKLWSMLDKVDLASFVKALPDGLDGWVGEQGQSLSGGQQKRLALARALLKNAPILVLDEPTEGLDRITEQKVFRHLKEAMQDKTVILVTHNAELAAEMDAVSTVVQAQQE